MKKFVLVTGCLAFSLTVTACTSKKDLAVSLTLSDQASYVSGCKQGSGGYSDVRDGMPVKLSDSKGEVIAIGAFKANRTGIDISSTGTEIKTIKSGTCNYTYKFEGVPTNHETYTITIGDGHRGDLVFTKNELSSNSAERMLAQIALGN